MGVRLIDLDLDYVTVYCALHFTKREHAYMMAKMHVVWPHDELPNDEVREELRFIMVKHALLKLCGLNILEEV